MSRVIAFKQQLFSQLMQATGGGFQVPGYGRLRNLPRKNGRAIVGATSNQSTTNSNKQNKKASNNSEREIEEETAASSRKSKTAP